MDLFYVGIIKNGSEDFRSHFFLLCKNNTYFVTKL